MLLPSAAALAWGSCLSWATSGRLAHHHTVFFSPGCNPSPPAAAGPCKRSYLAQRYDAVVEKLPAMTSVGAERLLLDPTLYAPPPLREHGAGWHPDWGKAWQYWGIPRYGI